MRRSLLGTLAALALLAGCGRGSPPTPPQVFAPTPAPTAAPVALPAGTYTSKVFSPSVTFTLPNGWAIGGDVADYLLLQPVTSDLTGIHLFRSPLAAAQDLDCPIKPAPGVGATAKDLVEWIRTRPGLVASDPVPVTIGGFTGIQVDLAIGEGWTASCPFANGTPTVPLFVGSTNSSLQWVVAGTERLRLDVLNIPGRGTIVVDIDAFDGALMDGLLSAALPIVAGMTFGAP